MAGSVCKVLILRGSRGMFIVALYTYSSEKVEIPLRQVFVRWI